MIFKIVETKSDFFSRIQRIRIKFIFKGWIHTRLFGTFQTSRAINFIFGCTFPYLHLQESGAVEPSEKNTQFFMNKCVFFCRTLYKIPLSKGLSSLIQIISHKTAMEILYRNLKSHLTFFLLEKKF